MTTIFKLVSLTLFVLQSARYCTAVPTVTTTLRPPPKTKAAATVTQEVAVNGLVDKYYMCQVKCKGLGEKLECGVNGWWFHNKCHRECEGIALSPTEQECDKYEKAEFERYYNCHMKCKEMPMDKECGIDGMWYENGCRMECYHIPKTNKTVCEKLDKVAECADECVGKGIDIKCGEDGDWYDNECHMNCSGVKAGVEGKDCEARINMAKYWECQEKCKDKQKMEECGQDGYYYFNSCHRNCYGAKLGVSGKDCLA